MYDFNTHTHTHSIILLLFIYYKQSSVTCAVGTALQPMGFATEGRPVPERARAPPGLSFLVEAGGEREEGGARTRSQSAPNTPAPPPLPPLTPSPSSLALLFLLHCPGNQLLGARIAALGGKMSA